MKANKHDHKGTKALKTALFSIVMLLPIISIGATILTHTFNEKVNTPSKDVTVNYMYETNEVNSQQDLIIGNAYTITLEDNSSLVDPQYFSNVGHGIEFYPLSPIYLYDFDSIEDWGGDDIFQEIIIQQPKQFTIAISKGYNGMWITTYLGNGTEDQSINVYFNDENNDASIFGNNNKIDFVYYGGNGNWTNYVSKLETNEYNPIKNIEITETADKITNIFEYASNEVFNTSVFRWTNSSIIKTPISAFTSVFGVDNANVLNNYLTYWLAVTGIYIVIDIIIETFVFITHLLNKDGI